MSTEHRSGFERAPIATRTELDHRISMRATPAPTLDLTMDGAGGAAVRRDIDRENEFHIRDIADRLADARRELRHDERLAQLRGHAKADFGRGD